MQLKFGVIGGDQRQVELVRQLREDGYETAACGLGFWLGEETPLEETAAADVVILPLPLCREAGYLNCRGERLPIGEVLDLFRSEQLILGGQIKAEQHREAQARGLRLVDYFCREELTVANAAATAEAAIQTAMEQMDRTLWGTSCLILGFGRIGRLLAHRLHGLGVDVTVAARSPEAKAWIRAYGYHERDIHNLTGNMDDYQIVFNTVPSQVMGEREIERLRGDCLCIDLASVPGIDQQALDRIERPYVWARFLPGRMVPKTAAEIIRDTTYNIVKEWGGAV